MHVLSYRGSGAAGGVSAMLSQAQSARRLSNSNWVHLNQSAVTVESLLAGENKMHFSLPKEMVENHYRYANEFIWPIMHDLPQFAQYDANKHRAYVELNACFASVASLAANENQSERDFFVNDYQLAPAVRYLAKNGAWTLNMFWHIPWPRHVMMSARPYIAQLVEGMLASSFIGFHTEEYVLNFLNFVKTNLPEYTVDWDRRLVFGDKNGRVNATRVVAAPLGIDFEWWQNAADGDDPETDRLIASLSKGKPFIFSADRADYTKGILERIEIADKLFRDNPELVGEISFMQICYPTRAGISAFDAYWREARERGKHVNERWRRGEWEPIVWLDKPVPPPILAKFYKAARVMLVSAVRDGLNLTAKEYVASQKEEPGALVLSQHAGAFSEMGDYAIALNPYSIDQGVSAIKRALRMSLKERAFRTKSMQRLLRGNSAEKWWHLLTQEQAFPLPFNESLYPRKRAM
ncbi:MAG TPA: trehalose-6-phosphate synthase [Candidatus Obscuribacterales bacterium]